jgi:hypothetical protein
LKVGTDGTLGPEIDQTSGLRTSNDAVTEIKNPATVSLLNYSAGRGSAFCGFIVGDGAVTSTGQLFPKIKDTAGDPNLPDSGVIPGR